MIDEHKELESKLIEHGVHYARAALSAGEDKSAVIAEASGMIEEILKARDKSVVVSVAYEKPCDVKQEAD
jgi:hypothetical protein